MQFGRLLESFREFWCNFGISSEFLQYFGRLLEILEILYALTVDLEGTRELIVFVGLTGTICTTGLIGTNRFCDFKIRKYF